MTKVGKILLFLNLSLGLLFAFWGVGLYMNRVNWTNTKTGDRPGVYAANTAEMDLYKKAIPLSIQGREAARAEVTLWEQRRPAHALKYGRLLESMRTGNDKIQVVRFLGGLLQIGPDGSPQFFPSEARSIKVNEQLYASKQKAILEVRADIAKLIKDEQALTDQLIGVNPGKIGGLRGDLAAADSTRQQSVDRQIYLKPLLYNRQVEAESLLTRNGVLLARLKELATVGAAPVGADGSASRRSTASRR